MTRPPPNRRSTVATVAGNTTSPWRNAFARRLSPFRLFTTILGICIADCYYLDMYHNQTTYGFREAVQRMAWAMIYNNLDKIDAGLVEPTDLFQRPAAEAEARSAFTQSPSQSGMSCGHIPVPLHCIPGYTGASQQNCVVCVANGVTDKLKTTYGCVICSTKDYVVAVHPPFFTQVRVRVLSRGDKALHTCPWSPLLDRPLEVRSGGMTPK